MVTGLERLLKSPELLSGRRVGLMTNRSGVTSALERNIEALLSAGVQLEVIFSPEHGLYAAARDGEPVSETKDKPTGITVISTYPRIDEAISRVNEFADVVLFDIQDVGARFYTYISTLRKFVEGAADNGYEVIVLDRPNPITGRVEGWLPEPEFHSFVCAADIPVRHGLTIGEVARLYATELGVTDLVDVITMPGYDKSMWFDELGLPWVPPSPNIPTPDTALVYAGMGFIEGTNMSEGRGTTRPFFTVGAPWMDAFRVADVMNSANLPGVKFLPAFFKPSLSKHTGKLCEGIEVFVTDRDAFRPVLTALKLIETAMKLYPDDFEWVKHGDEYWIDKLAGTSKLREAIEQGGLDDFLNENSVNSQIDIYQDMLLY